jgi:hypothetical protein
MLKELNNNHNNPWFTAYYPDCIAGFRLNSELDMAEYGAFFVLNDDDVRTLVFPGPHPNEIIKPDHCGTVCVSVCFPSGVTLTACTNGDIRIESDSELEISTQLRSESRRQHHHYPLLSEQSRFVGQNGTIVRTFATQSSHPFAKEIIRMDGSRELFLKADYSPSQYQAFLETSEIFESFLLSLLPIDVRWISLFPDGNCESCNLLDDGVTFVRNGFLDDNFLEEFEDAETKTITKYFKDGRIITQYSQGSFVTIFPDRSQFLYNNNVGLLNITRGDGWPSVEVDCEVDSMCRSHCRGLEVPINKGGERVRLRTALPDGSALLMKYDTKVTAKTNGSLKYVSRNRTSLLARDDGSVVFTPSTAWTSEVS